MNKFGHAASWNEELWQEEKMGKQNTAIGGSDAFVHDKIYYLKEEKRRIEFCIWHNFIWNFCVWESHWAQLQQTNGYRILVYALLARQRGRLWKRLYHMSTRLSRSNHKSNACDRYMICMIYRSHHYYYIWIIYYYHHSISIFVLVSLYSLEASFADTILIIIIMFNNMCNVYTLYRAI